tara:strand:+ start:252 stop:1466 length:1215 start_codon:yes stop_codon:yes gene_type:complete
MQGFIHYLEEAKNTHLEHLEDEIINNGSRGALNAVNFLKSIRQMFRGGSGRTSLTVKWDGAPAIVCGRNPDNGRFFVGTKSVFNKTPKINYTSADIRKNHSGAVADKLEICLRELPKLGIKGILQGDLLFTRGELKTANIDGEKNIVFTPNTITYAVPTGTPLASRIANANLGIIFHTTYTGKSFNSLSASFGANVSGLRRSRRVFYDDASYRDASSAKFSPGELTQFDNVLRMAMGSIQKGAIFMDLLRSDTNILSVGVQLKAYINSYIRQGTGLGTVKKLAGQFAPFYRERVQAEIDRVSRPDSKRKYKEIQTKGLSMIKGNTDGLYFALATYLSLQKAKLILMNKLRSVQSIGTFLRTDNGFKVTSPEGYVAIKSSGAVKLVDRMEFSRANFNMAKDWVKG